MNTHPQIGTDQATSPAEQAMALLAPFCTRLLPGTLRRIIAWKRLPRTALPDLTEDVHQELALDCLQHAEAILALPANNRHLRWMRVAERWVYRTRVQPSREHRLIEDSWATPEAREDLRSMPWLDMVALHNGRRNLGATAARHGMRVRELQRAIDDHTAAAGYDEDHYAFWRQRAAEALTGLAADLLRESSPLLLLSRRRRRPDPVARLLRLKQLAQRFPVRPVTRSVRVVLQPWVRRPRLDERSPRRLLAAALRLTPQSAAAALWLFEACVCDGDLAAAARALRQAQHSERPPHGSITLARARLLEVRGRPQAAVALVRRAHRRWRCDHALSAVVARLNAQQ